MVSVKVEYIGIIIVCFILDKKVILKVCEVVLKCINKSNIEKILIENLNLYYFLLCFVSLKSICNLIIYLYV